MMYTEAKFCEPLREHVLKTIGFKKKEMKPLTKEQQQSYEKAKICYTCKEKLKKKHLRGKKYRKVRDHCHYTGKYIGAAHSICNLKYSEPKKNYIAFHNGSNYGYRVMIKKLEEEFKKQF